MTVTKKKLMKLAEAYALQELEKGEHPDEVEFELVNIIADALDQYGTDEDGHRVDFEDSVYYKERKK